MRTTRVQERERERERERRSSEKQCRQGALGFKASEVVKTAAVITLRLLVLKAMSVNMREIWSHYFAVEKTFMIWAANLWTLIACCSSTRIWGCWISSGF